MNALDELISQERSLFDRTPHLWEKESCLERVRHLDRLKQHQDIIKEMEDDLRAESQEWWENYQERKLKQI